MIDNVDIPPSSTESLISNRLHTDPNYSRPLDVHTWSDYPEVNTMVDEVLGLLPSDQESRSNRKGTSSKKILKVLLLDLYVAWRDDPALWIGIGLADSYYRVNSRYNALHISKKLPRLVHALRDVGLLDWVNHSHNASNPRGNRTTRIRASENLHRIFQSSALDLEMLSYNHLKEVIVLRDIDVADETSDEVPRGKKGKARDLEYSDVDMPLKVRESRQTLHDYNGLLNRSHIDIGTLDEPRYQRTTDDGRNQTITINQGRHCVRRVFSRGSFECNGRYYGGWWQSCPKAYRKHIRINRQPTIEVDYSAMHPMILSAEKGIHLEEDPYTLTTKISEQIDPHTQRRLVKGFVLVSINAANQDQAYKAFKSKHSGEFDVPLTKALFQQVHEAFVNDHPALEDCLYSDQGIRLMNIDSEIVGRIIGSYVHFDKPILSIHDSFIVPTNDVNNLEFAMEKVSEAVLGKPLKFKRDKVYASFSELPPKHLDADFYHRSFEQFVSDYQLSPGYDQRWRQWLRST